MIARTARMLGHPVHFPIGIDRNGLPVELYTERTYKVSLRHTPRDRFLDLCRHALDDLEAEMLRIMRTMGLSGDFAHHYRTDAEDYRAFTQATFIALWHKGVVYQATRPNNFCSDCGTTIADAEIEYEELPAKLVYMRFRVRETGETLVVASTRPELLCSCQTVIFHPDDQRHKRLQGLHVILPIYEREVPIRPHPSAKPEFGSGAVMVCSYGDYTDVLLFRQLNLPERIAIDEEGRMTETAGLLRGLSVAQARDRMIEELQQRGLVDRIETIQHRTPLCGRSRTPIEIIPMQEYYLKQVEYLQQLRQLARRTRFHPDAHRQLLLDWLNAVTIDWPLSRRRYYATEVPVWYCKACGDPHVPEPGPYYQPWRQKAPFPRCQRCGASEFMGDERTFDTWMDSSVSALYVTKYQRDRPFHRRTYPTSLRPQGKDIVRTWLHYSILRCWLLTQRAPFAHAWIFGMGLDEHGRQMSKSRGNVIDPIPILEKYGADTFRFWSAQEASLGYDFRCSEARIAGAGKFLTKLWNLARFISSFPQPRQRPRLAPADRWILAELARLIREALDGYREFNFFVPATKAREFTWNLFAAHYVEMVKARAYGTNGGAAAQRAAWFTLHTCLRAILLLLAPLIPFITESVWRQLYGRTSIHRQQFPRAPANRAFAAVTPELVQFNSMVWNVKKERGLSLKEGIDMPVPVALAPFGADLRAMHALRT
jgi:valyl-tRNA synthetase